MNIIITQKCSHEGRFLHRSVETLIPKWVHFQHPLQCRLSTLPYLKFQFLSVGKSGNIHWNLKITGFHLKIKNNIVIANKRRE